MDQPEYGCDSPWLEPIRAYIGDGTLPAEKWATRKIKTQAARYVTVEGEIHKWRFSGPLMTCAEGEKARKVMEEVHSGSCGNHSGGRSLAVKIKRHGYYLLTMIKDCEKFARKCEKCQRHARQSINPRKPSRPSRLRIPSCDSPWISSGHYTTRSRNASSWSSRISSQSG